MNDPKLALDSVEALIKELERHGLSFAEKAGLFAAMRILEGDIDVYIDDHAGGNGYAHEKIRNVRWHVAAALGFDITNNHPAEQHRSWARGDLHSLRSTLKDGTA